MQQSLYEAAGAGAPAPGISAHAGLSWPGGDAIVASDGTIYAPAHPPMGEGTHDNQVRTWAGAKRQKGDELARGRPWDRAIRQYASSPKGECAGGRGDSHTTHHAPTPHHHLTPTHRR